MSLAAARSELQQALDAMAARLAAAQERQHQLEQWAGWRDHMVRGGDGEGRGGDEGGGTGVDGEEEGTGRGGGGGGDGEEEGTGEEGTGTERGRRLAVGITC
jgi:hypothetical protein